MKKISIKTKKISACRFGIHPDKSRMEIDMERKRL